MPVTGSAVSRIWVEAPAVGLEAAGGNAPGQLVVPAGGTAEHPWDQAHRLARDPAAAGLEAVGPVYAEPDLVQEFPHERATDRGLESFTAPPCADEPHDDFWPVGSPAFGWHLDEHHSGLKAARDRVGDPPGWRVRVVILDTGYDPAHATVPLHLNGELARNFADGDPADATDPARHFPGDQPGHGTATLALLAGRRVAVPRGGFDDYLGGAPFAELVPVRIADSVVHFRTSSMAAGIHYAADVGAAVVSISMGGVPNRAWADAVNRAYEAGLTIVAAAGNRFGPSPPSSIIYPARFNRVIAACGVTADGSPYYRPGLHRHMQGCFGPPSKMGTALAAYTPNAPWAVLGCPTQVGFGGGTSSATPQIAAAAALWLRTHLRPPEAEPWTQVEAVRFALFSSADKESPDRETYFGQGLLRAAAALDVPFRTDLPMTPPDTVSFPWLRLLGALEAVEAPPPGGEELMFEVEALQVYLQSPWIQELAGGADPQTDPLPPGERKRIIEALRAAPMTSKALRAHLDTIRRGL